jgi:hypothetical protein
MVAVPFGDDGRFPGSPLHHGLLGLAP